MLVVEVVLVAAVLFAVAAVAAGRGGWLGEAPPDRPDLGLPADRRLTSADVPSLRFRLALRGYRMGDVDAAMDRLREALAALEERAAAEPDSPAAEEPAGPELPAAEEPAGPELLSAEEPAGPELLSAEAPADPVQPEQPPHPAEPVHPVEPVRPAEPMRPEPPSRPEEPARPLEPVVPPVQPAPRPTDE